MTAHFLQVAGYLLVLVGLSVPLGRYMAAVYQGQPPRCAGLLAPLERLVYRIGRVRPEAEMDWRTYALALLVFNVLGLLAAYLIQRVQDWLPLNPQGFGPVPADCALNTATSFATNTNWQGYGGETTMSYFTQMAALTVQNFLSAATGMAVLLPLIRGFARRTTDLLGNFWADLTRSVVYVLLPLSIVLALALVSQGVIQNFKPYAIVPLLEGARSEKPLLAADGSSVLDEKGQPRTESVVLREQTLAMGPAASQVAIKQLGTNGGGFFNANSAHPFENPTPFSNFLQVLAILLIPAALCHTFGRMVGDARQGWALLAAMTLLFVAALAVCWWAESSGNPRLTALGVDQALVDPYPMEQGSPHQGPVRKPGAAPNAQSGGNMEGKEVRFGIFNTALWATATTAASNGSVNGTHDSLTPLGGMVPMVLMQLGEVVFGGVGSGLYGMLAFVIIAVFVAGLMVGRTPEYLGKKIEAYEMKAAVLVILIPPAIVKLATAAAVLTDAGTSSVLNPGPHGFSEILYAFSSMGNNNGSAYAGLSTNKPFYNVLGAVVMLITRYWLAIPILAIAGSLARKKIVPTGVGTLPTYTPLFIGWLILVVLIVGALTFFPALCLGPIVEHLQAVP